MNVGTLILIIRSTPNDIDKNSILSRRISRVNDLDWADLADIIECYSSDYSKIKAITIFISTRTNDVKFQPDKQTLTSILDSISNDDHKNTALKHIQSIKSYPNMLPK